MYFQTISGQKARTVLELISLFYRYPVRTINLSDFHWGGGGGAQLPAFWCDNSLIIR